MIFLKKFKMAFILGDFELNRQFTEAAIPETPRCVFDLPFVLDISQTSLCWINVRRFRLKTAF